MEKRKENSLFALKKEETRCSIRLIFMCIPI